MQIKKHEVREKIIESGKILFKENGFSKTSMRKVAERSNISVSNIYNYFKNKDELFLKIISPAKCAYEGFYERLSKEEVWNNQELWTIEGDMKFIESLVDLMFDQRDEFILLFQKADGSKLEKYREEILKVQIEISNLVNMKANHFLKKPVPTFIVEHTVRMYTNTIIDGFLEGMSKEEIMKRVEEIMYFLFYGYVGYFNDELKKNLEDKKE